MAAVDDGDVLDQHVAAQLQRDGLVAVQRCGLRGATTDQTLAVDLPGTGDRHVGQVLAPDQAVVPVAVPEVLERVAGARLGRVVPAPVRRCGGQDRGVVREVQFDVALQVDRVAGVGTGREVHGATATVRGGRLDDLVDDVGIDGDPVPLGTEPGHVEDPAQCPRLRRRDRGIGERRGTTERQRRTRRPGRSPGDYATTTQRHVTASPFCSPGSQIGRCQLARTGDPGARRPPPRGM